MSREDYVAFFKEADSDGSGSLSLKELMTILKGKGYKASDSEIKAMFANVDTSGDGAISMDEYMVAMGQQPPAVHGVAAMRRVFVDVDKDGNGRIDKSELKQLFTSLGKHFNDAQLTRMMELCDEDGSGDMDYNEFLKNVFGVSA